MPPIDETPVRVPAYLIAESEAVLQQLGLSIDDAVRLFLAQVALRRGLPFAVTLPPEVTDGAGDDLLAAAKVRQAVLDSFYDDTEAR